MALTLYINMVKTGSETGFSSSLQLVLRFETDFLLERFYLRLGESQRWHQTLCVLRA